MRVVVDGVIGSYQKVGGISRLFQEILPRMAKQDSSLEIVVLPTTDVWKRLSQREGRIRIFPQLPWQAGHIKGWPFLARRLINPLLQRAVLTPDTIWHSTYFTLPPRRNVPNIVTVHDLISEMNLIHVSEMFHEQKRQAILRADKVICVSECTRRDVIRFYSVVPEKVVVVWNGYNNDTFNTDKEQMSNSPNIVCPYLLYVGRRQGYKNFDLLLQAYAQWQERKEVILIVVGSEWTADEKQRLAEFNLTNEVVRLENVMDEHLRDLYQNALAFVFPSLYEGFGIPLLEAMACGCPIIASRIPTTVEIAEDCPIYFSPGDQKELQECFDAVFSQNSLKSKIASGLSIVKKYSWDKTAAKTLSVYRELGA